MNCLVPFLPMVAVVWLVRGLGRRRRGVRVESCWLLYVPTVSLSDCVFVSSFFFLLLLMVVLSSSSVLWRMRPPNKEREREKKSRGMNVKGNENEWLTGTNRIKLCFF